MGYYIITHTINNDNHIGFYKVSFFLSAVKENVAAAL